LRPLRGSALPGGRRATAAAVFEAHAVEPALHRVLIEQLPRIGRLQRIRAIEAEVA